KPDRLDLALIHSDAATVGAAVFTTNSVKAAPVLLSASHLEEAAPRTIIANSGNANACTGVQGMKDACEMSKVTAKELGLSENEILVCSTGIIGNPLPIDRITPNVAELVEALEPNNSDAAAAAIMTSDTRPKSYAVQVKHDDYNFKIGGIAKGAGMINPQMATMLCFITTDAAVTKAELIAATRQANEATFNCISVDGDMSTNDTVIVIANGEAGNPPITRGGKGSEEFREALTQVMMDLALKIVGDGERVTKLVEVQVRGAKSQIDAERVARAVANSKLVKCSWNGCDPNWGRIIHAVGYSGASIKEEMVDIYFDGKAAAKNGLTADTPIKELNAVARKKKFTVGIDLNLGKGEFTIYTSDLSPEYVDFNREEYALSKRS
ncbi:MAG: bifunctional glutamate N-acetyltransferase/amino-acid acetyltransferase ArgJ, partial [Verrucomicrobiota bacterium]